MSDQESSESGQVERHDLERQQDPPEESQNQPDLHSTEPSGPAAPGWVSGEDVVTPERQAESSDDDYNDQIVGEAAESSEET